MQQREIISIPNPNKTEIKDLKTVLAALGPIQFNKKLEAYTVGITNIDTYKMLVSKKQSPQSFFCRAYLGIFEYKTLNKNNKDSHLVSILEKQLDQYAAWLDKAKQYAKESSLQVAPSYNSTKQPADANKPQWTTTIFNPIVSSQQAPTTGELADGDFTKYLNDFDQHPETQWLKDDVPVVIKRPQRG